MSYQSSKWIPLSEKQGVFSGGYVDNVSNFDMSPNSSPYLRNCRLDGQNIAIRPGHNLFATLTAGDYPRGIGSYLRTTASNDRIVVRHNQAYTSAYLTGGTSATVWGATWNVTDGEFAITIDGTAYDITGLDFSSTTDEDGIAAVIQAGIRTATSSTETCVWDTDHFIISSVDTTSSSAITVTSAVSGGVGTDISGAGATEFMDCETGVGTVTNKLTNKLVTIDEDGTVTPISTAALIASDNRMTFSNVGDVIYCMNGSDLYGKLSGTTYTNPTTGVATFTPKFGVMFNSSMFCGGVASAPNTVYKSVGDDYDDFNSAGSDSFTFPETITGLAVNNEALFYFTKNTISTTGTGDITDTAGTITYITRALEVKEGATNHECIVSAGNMIYFVTPSNKIAQIARGKNIDGFEVLELSERKYEGIDKIMETLDDDQSAAFGYYCPKQNIIKRFFKTAGASINDICIVYDVGKDSFLVDSNKFFYHGTSWRGDNYTVSMVEGKVYQDEYGLDDEGSSIPFEYRTKEFYIADPTFKKVFRETRTLLDINDLASLTQEIWINEGLEDSKTVNSDNITLSTGGIGTESVGVDAIGTEGDDPYLEDSDYHELDIMRTKGNLNIRGKKIQFRFTNQVVGSKVRLKNVSAKVEVLPELVNNLTT